MDEREIPPPFETERPSAAMFPSPEVAREALAAIANPVFHGSDDQRIAFYTSFIKAQGEFEDLLTNKTGKVSYKAKGDREGGSFTFEYADLFAIIKNTRKTLTANGIGVMQPLYDKNRTMWMKTWLIHVAGGMLEVDLQIPFGASTDPKDMAGDISYWKRYTIGALLWLAADDDIDAHTKEVPDELIVDAYVAAESGVETLRSFWDDTLDEEQRVLLMPRAKKLKGIAERVDNGGPSR